MFGNLRSATLSIKQSLCNSLGLPFPELLEIAELDELVKGTKVKELFANSGFQLIEQQKNFSGSRGRRRQK